MGRDLESSQDLVSDQDFRVGRGFVSVVDSGSVQGLRSIRDLRLDQDPGSGSVVILIRGVGTDQGCRPGRGPGSRRVLELVGDPELSGDFGTVQDLWSRSGVGVCRDHKLT